VARVQWPPMPGARKPRLVVRKPSSNGHTPSRRRTHLGVVDYTLAKRALLREWRRGLLSRLEICDAHPELLRAARYLGADAGRPCPVCNQHELRLLAYVYAEGLRANNGRAFEVQEGLALAAQQQAGACYVVEVCTYCNWNHLSEAFLGRSVG
jgi:uncharacterized protein DUF5318